MKIPTPVEGSELRPSEESQSPGRQFLPALAFDALAALAAGVVDRAGGVEPEQVARNVDTYMASFRAQRKWVGKVALVGLWLYPLRFLAPPFPKMDSERRRRFVKGTSSATSPNAGSGSAAAWSNMPRFRNLTAAGVLVGTPPRGSRKLAHDRG